MERECPMCGDRMKLETRETKYRAENEARERDLQKEREDLEKNRAQINTEAMAKVEDILKIMEYGVMATPAVVVFAVISIVYGALMAIGVALHLTERHEHWHAHEPLQHELELLDRDIHVLDDAPVQQRRRHGLAPELLLRLAQLPRDHAAFEHGAASTVLPFGEEQWRRGLEAAIPAKILEVNLRAFELGRAADASADRERARELAVGDREVEARVLESFGLGAWHGGDIAGARRYFERASAAFDDPGLRARTHVFLANALYFLGAVDEARKLLFVAGGFGGQYLFIVPDLELTIVATRTASKTRRACGAACSLVARSVTPPPISRCTGRWCRCGASWPCASAVRIGRGC